MDKPLIAPSILAADFSKLGEEVKMLNESEADIIHIDIMDGVFVPNISFGFPVMDAIKKSSDKTLDVHLMIIDADKYIDDFVKAGAHMISVHYEACTHLHRTINHIKSQGVKAGVVLNPHTPVHLLKDILAELDFVLLMSVNPGYGGQKFIPAVINKVRELKSMCNELNPNCLIEIDGGVNADNAESLIAAGADILVAGSFVFKASEPSKVISQLKNIPKAKFVA